MPPSMPDEVVIDVNAIPPKFGLHANPPVSFVVFLHTIAFILLVLMLSLVNFCLTVYFFVFQPPASGSDNTQAQEVVTPAIVHVGAPAVASAVAPDPLLPPPGSVAVPNFSVDPGVLAWAVQVLDTVAWSAEDRKSLKTQFTPEAEHAHVFEPVSMPQEILDAMKHKSVVASDFVQSL